MKFRMVDRIINFVPEKSIRGVKTVSFEEYQLKSAFGDEPALPETLIMESLFQLGNWLIMLTSDFSKMGLLIRTNKVLFEQPLRPGQSMLMDIKVQSYRNDGILFDGQASVEGQVIAKGKGCLAAPAELSEYYDPEDMKMLFSEIYHPDNCRGE